MVPEEEIDKGKVALTELFEGVRNENTPIIVKRVVDDIDEIVKYVRFPGWQDTSTGRQDVKRLSGRRYGLSIRFMIRNCSIKPMSM